MNWKRNFALLAVPAVLALGGGALAVQAASSPAPSTPASQSQTGAAPAEATEPAEAVGAAEAVDAPEASGAPDVGHADAPGANVDHQFEGNE